VIGHTEALDALDEPWIAQRLQRPLLAQVRRWLRECHADAAEVADIMLACTEACENAIEHAYDLGPDLFDVEFERVGHEVSILVRDRGTWREPAIGAGRGLTLMRQLMDHVAVDAGPSGTTVLLRRRLRDPRASDQDA